MWNEYKKDDSIEIENSQDSDVLSLGCCPLSSSEDEAPWEIVFQEQSYSSLHSGRSLAWDHFCGDIDDPCGVIANFCGVIAAFCGVIGDPCDVVTIPEAIGGHAVADAVIPIVA